MAKDLFDKILNGTRGSLGQYADQGEGYYFFPKFEGELGPRMKFNGTEMLNWSINNYLGLGNHPEVRKIDAEAAKDWGLSYPMGSRMMSGNTKYHDQLEQELATFVHKEAGILLNFGYQGMASIFDALVDRHDVIVYDSESHACIIDGVRKHLGKRFTFDHNNMESFEKNMERATNWVEKTGGAILVVSEGVFGMRGDQGKLKEIIEYKKKFDFRFLVDDAHGIGVLGKTGAGAGEEQGVQDGIDIYFGTFAKAFASVGAFFAGDKDIIRHIKYNIRSQIYAKSLPMPLVIGALKRLDMMRTMPELKENLWKITNALQSGLKERGFEIGDTSSCVTPVYMQGSIAEASQLVYDLRENHHVFCSLVIYPVVPKGMIILRLIPTGAHELRDVEETLTAFEAVAKKLKNGDYSQEIAEATLD